MQGCLAERTRVPACPCRKSGTQGHTPGSAKGLRGVSGPLFFLDDGHYVAGGGAATGLGCRLADAPGGLVIGGLAPPAGRLAGAGGTPMRL